MKTIIVLVFLFAAQVLCQTNQQVIEEFHPILRRHYDSVLEIVNEHEAASYRNLLLLSNSTYQIQRRLLRDQLRQRISIRVQIEKIITELHLPASNIRVRWCVSQSNEMARDMVSRSWGGLSACEAAIQAPIKRALAAFTYEYMRIQNIHNTIQNLGNDCTSISTSAAQLRNCLNYGLFVTHSHTIDDLGQSVQRVINDTDSAYRDAVSQIEECSGHVRHVLDEDAESIVLGFRDCASAIADQK